jgi:rhamnogalacturonan hydrolase
MVDKSSVGCLTGLEAKSTICNVLDYGGVADNKTDIALAIQLAFSSCASKGGATLYIPPGNYLGELHLLYSSSTTDLISRYS